MPDKTCKLIELVGVSGESCGRAGGPGPQGGGLVRSDGSPGLVRGGQVSEFQVKFKVGCRSFSEDEVRGA
jgi:flavin-binding protein dodecin